MEKMSKYVPIVAALIAAIALISSFYQCSLNNEKSIEKRLTTLENFSKAQINTGLEDRVSKLEERVSKLERLPPSPTNGDFPISYLVIDNFDVSGRTVSGRAVLSREEGYRILIFAGKAGGPYWLQGGGGKFFSEDTRRREGASWIIEWTVPEVYTGSEVQNLRAVAVPPSFSSEEFEAKGIVSPDPNSGNALKVSSLAKLPEPKVVSPKFELRSQPPPSPSRAMNPSCFENLLNCSVPIAIFVPGQSTSTGTLISEDFVVKFRNDKNGTGIGFLFTPSLDLRGFNWLVLKGTSTEAFTFVVEYKVRKGTGPVIVATSRLISFPMTPGRELQSVRVPLNYTGEADEIVINCLNVGNSSTVKIRSIQLQR